MDYLESIGVVVYDHENALQALKRHATMYDWRIETFRKHKQILQEEVAYNVEEQLNDLDFMNFVLDKFGYAPENSKRRARDALSGLYINIYDFEAEIYYDHGSLRNLREYTLRKKLVYPREEAKENGFKVFLKKLF